MMKKTMTIVMMIMTITKIIMIRAILNILFLLYSAQTADILVYSYSAE